jgi:hypothetical protein
MFVKKYVQFPIIAFHIYHKCTKEFFVTYIVPHRAKSDKFTKIVPI